MSGGLSFYMSMAAHQDAGVARTKAVDAKTQSTNTALELRTLRSQFFRTQLACEALWSLVQERLELTDEELRDRMAQLDLEDGVADGRRKHPPQSCPRCQRTFGRHWMQCLYCGEPVQGDAFA